jgi:hypothetical protein
LERHYIISPRCCPWLHKILQCVNPGQPGHSSVVRSHTQTHQTNRNAGQDERRENENDVASSSDDSDGSSVDSAVKRSRAAAALVQDYGDMQDTMASSHLPPADLAFTQVPGPTSGCFTDCVLLCGACRGTGGW